MAVPEVIARGTVLEFRFKSVGKRGSVEIISCRGESVFKQSVGSGSYATFDASKLASGAYAAIFSVSGIRVSVAKFVNY